MRMKNNLWRKGGTMQMKIRNKMEMIDFNDTKRKIMMIRKRKSVCMCIWIGWKENSGKREKEKIDYVF